jgi:hypothetical protein
MDQSNPKAALFRKSLQQQHLRLAAALLGSPQPRGKHPGIIENQQVSGIEKISKIGKDGVN